MMGHRPTLKGWGTRSPARQPTALTTRDVCLDSKHNYHLIALCMHNLDAVERRRYPAPYAAMSHDSQGRTFPIAADPYRTEYQRDRDRIIHSTAFRRLQHKTQVFSNLGDEGDHYRTRLTHTIEVAQISRTIARSLGLNEDLAEAVALAHDLGHTPFGHAGEEVLDDLTAPSGGFNHNQQSLRVVDYLEKRYPGHFGLNLTYELREAIIKHETGGAIVVPEEFNPSENPLLEGQIVNLADEIAYSGHDVDDGLASELLSLDMLCATGFLCEIMEEMESHLTEKTPAMIRHALVRGIVNRMVVDLVAEIGRRLKDSNIQTVADVRRCQNPLVTFSPKQAEFNHELREFLNQHIYRHPNLEGMKTRSREIMTFLFHRYQTDPEEISSDFRQRYPDADPLRLAVDYIAGMTDRFALSEFNRLQE